jgi:diguanylate cyclase (GGDEF)-like protein/putative nucleotidyltransferase with HDIG domain
MPLVARNGKQDGLEQTLAAARQRIAALEAALSEREGSDPITGLPDLRRFRAQVDIEVQRARRHGRPLVAALVDIDGFRQVNAAHGYAVGDQTLAATATVLRSHTRVHDLVCRTGGDEFALLMPETEMDGAEACLERILLELEATGVGPLHCISMSAGLASFDRTQGAAQLLAVAGDALSGARAGGGSRIGRGSSKPAEVVDERQRDAVAGLAVALLERDRYTGEHSEFVVELAAAVGRTIGLADDEIDRVRAAALLHDIGKVAIPDEILNKPGGLTDDEWKLMKDHTVIGERILRAIPGLGGVARIVRHEHERWDGGGYPDGIAGEEIPIGSRIILACDAFHAMTSDRPYRAAMPHEEAVGELIKHAGSQFDPDVIQALVGELYVARQSGTTR